jgi:hypothetical protein
MGCNSPNLRICSFDLNPGLRTAMKTGGARLEQYEVVIMKNRSWSWLIGTLFIVLLSASPLRAQQSSTDDLRNEIKALTQTVKEMQKDLQEIKTLLLSSRPAAPPHNVVLDLSNSRRPTTCEMRLKRSHRL